MRYATVRPPPDLAAVVEVVWFLSGPAPPAGAGAEPVLPDGTCEIVLHRGAPFEAVDGGGRARLQPGAVWVGQLSGPLSLRPSGAFDVVGVRLRAEGAARLSAAPQAELVDRWVELEALRPALGRPLVEAAQRDDEAGVAAAVFEALRRSLLPPRGSADALDAVCGAARAAPGAVTVEGLAHEAGVSPRTLERWFRRDVGFSPKRWLRLLRFQRVIAGGGGEGLLVRALAAGYYDQAHFLRDFREFAGTTPGAFFGTEGDALAHLFLEG